MGLGKAGIVILTAGTIISSKAMAFDVKPGDFVEVGICANQPRVTIYQAQRVKCWILDGTSKICRCSSFKDRKKKLIRGGQSGGSDTQ